jgi:hypothetical protein
MILTQLKACDTVAGDSQIAGFVTILCFHLFFVVVSIVVFIASFEIWDELSVWACPVWSAVTETIFLTFTSIG